MTAVLLGWCHLILGIQIATITCCEPGRGLRRSRCVYATVVVLWPVYGALGSLWGLWRWASRPNTTKANIPKPMAAHTRAMPVATSAGASPNQVPRSM